jgi:hypothetical protein
MEQTAAIGGALQQAVQTGVEALQWILEHARESRDVAGASGVNFLMLLGYTCGGWIMGLSALKASKILAGDGGDAAFLKAKLVTAKFYCDHLLPRTGACLASVKAGPESMMEMPAGQF